MKKPICIALILLLLLAVTGCSSSGTSPSQTQAPKPSTAAPAPDTKAPAPDTKAPDTQAPAPDTQAPDTQAPDTQAPDTQAPEPDDDSFPTLPPVSDDFSAHSEYMELGFQWTEVFPGYDDSLDAFHSEEYFWDPDNYSHFYFTNEAGDCLDVTPLDPVMSPVTSMEYETVQQTTGLEPWLVYRVPYSREIAFHSSRNVRPISISAQWDDCLVELWAANIWDAQITTAGIYFDGSNDYGHPEEPLAYEVNFLLYYGANGQRWLTVTSPDSEAFLLTRDGNYFTVTSKGECSITIIDRTNGREDVMLNTSVPSRATWYVVDLAADHADLQTGIE